MCKFKKLVASLLAATLLFASSVTALANDLPSFSDYAKEEVELAKKDGLVPIDLILDCSRSIKRMHATVLVVNFVEVMTEQKITDCKSGPFSDTAGIPNWEDINKAYATGITKGVGDGTKFMPFEYLTREEYANMLYRAVCYIEKVKSVRILPQLTANPDYSDWNKVSSWAQDGVNAMASAKIFKGSSAASLSPKDEVSIEQAVILVYRCSNFVKDSLKNSK